MAIKLKQMVLLPCLALAGCSMGGQDNFSTEPGKGYGWKSMGETHQLIQQEMRNNSPAGIGLAEKTSQPYIVSMAGFEGIERIPERYLKIWIPPYQDGQGNLHEESSVQTVIKQGQWKIANPQIDTNRKA